MAPKPLLGGMIMIVGAGLVILNPGIFGNENAMDFVAGAILVVIGFVVMAGTGTSSKNGKMEEKRMENTDKVFRHETRQQTEETTESIDEKNHVTRKIETEKTETKTQIEEE